MLCYNESVNKACYEHLEGISKSALLGRVREDFKKRWHSHKTLKKGKELYKQRGSVGITERRQPQESVQHATRAVSLQHMPQEAGGGDGGAGHVLDLYLRGNKELFKVFR